MELKWKPSSALFWAIINLCLLWNMSTFWVHQNTEGVWMCRTILAVRYARGRCGPRFTFHSWILWFWVKQFFFFFFSIRQVFICQAHRKMWGIEMLAYSWFFGVKTHPSPLPPPPKVNFPLSPNPWILEWKPPTSSPPLLQATYIMHSKQKSVRNLGL